MVYTPAIPISNTEWVYFSTHGFQKQKRAEVLGDITRLERGLCVAGTHGKTSVSTMAAHLLKQSSVDCKAFLGGIALGYESNLMLSDKSDLVVIEADEFDRSFHQLNPYMAVVTACDPDHLDIYGTYEAYLESFAHFTSLIVPQGTLIMKTGLKLIPRLQEGVKLLTYCGVPQGEERPDFYASNLKVGDGSICFDFVTPKGVIKAIELGVPMLINVENGVVAMALAWLNGVKEDELRHAMKSFKGIRRRFEYHLKSEHLQVIDDYAHHPMEVKASIESIKEVYKNRSIVVAFQPHLYSRTRDFYLQFAEVLSLLDRVIIVDLYPAREQPIPGISSQLIYEACTSPEKHLCSKEDLIELCQTLKCEVFVTLGAGDLNTCLPRIIEALKKNNA